MSSYVSISANSSSSKTMSTDVITGYSRVIWWGVCVNDGGSGESSCNLYNLVIESEGDPSTIAYIRNFSNSTVKVKVNIRMLYVKNKLL